MADSAHSQGGQDGHGGPGGQYGYGYGGPGYGGGQHPEMYPGYGYGYGGPQGPGGYGGPQGPGGYGGPQGGQGRFQMEMSSPLDAEIQVVIREIHNELAMFEQAGEYGEQFKNAKRLLAAEAEKLENSVDPEWLEVDIPKQIKVTKKVLIPNFRHPHFNFVGKVLGPRGQTLQAIAKQFKCHIYVLGRGSTKDRAKEQEQLNSGDPQYSHFGGPLHVKVETIAPPHIAYGRIAGVLEVLSNTLIPVRDAPDAQGIGADKPKDEDGGQEGENGKDDGDRGNGDDNERRGGGGPRGGRGGYRGRGGPPSAMGIGGIRGRGMIRKHPMGPPMGGGYQGGFGGRGGRGGGPPRGGPGFRPY